MIENKYSELYYYMDDKIAEEMIQRLGPCGDIKFICSYTRENNDFIEILKDNYPEIYQEVLNNY